MIPLDTSLASRNTSMIGGAPAAASNANGADSIARHTTSIDAGAVTSSERARKLCLLAACATRPHRLSRPLRDESSSSPSPAPFLVLRTRDFAPSRSPPPMTADRVVTNGVSRRAPSSAAFSTNVSPRPPFNPPNATMQSQSKPLLDVSRVNSLISTAASPRASTSRIVPRPTPPTPSHTSSALPGFKRKALVAWRVSSLDRRTNAPGPNGSST
mmetsp:Transcript_6038/g.21802  ORF Transcript_6038/g.21802 Transcript_6038/m.21802 type:complete len:214 (+) Transcript_6038:209-850(+)